MGDKWRLSHRTEKELGASHMDELQQSTSIMELIYLLFSSQKCTRRDTLAKGTQGLGKKRFIINLQQKSLGNKLESMIELSPFVRHHYPQR